MKNKSPFLELPKVIKMKIFLYKMKTLYKELNQKIYYLPNEAMTSGAYGIGQLFTISDQMYFYSPTPAKFQFRKVIGIYTKSKYTFMILQREDNLYEIQKDNFLFYNIFKSVDECKKYIEDF